MEVLAHVANVPAIKDGENGRDSQWRSFLEMRERRYKRKVLRMLAM
jgi:hypothetical protein